MTVAELHSITADLVASGKGDSEVAIDFDTFSESENGSILSVDRADARNVQGVDDSGPVGEEFPFFVLSGSGCYLSEPTLRRG
jgi:hypothetical protein